MLCPHTGQHSLGEGLKNFFFKCGIFHTDQSPFSTLFCHPPQNCMREQLVWMTPGFRESVKSLSACRDPTTIIVTEKTIPQNIRRIINQVVLLE